MPASPPGTGQHADDPVLGAQRGQDQRLGRELPEDRSLEHRIVGGVRRPVRLQILEVLENDRAPADRVQDLLGHVIGGVRQQPVAALGHQIDTGGVGADGLRGFARDPSNDLLQLERRADRPPDVQHRLRGAQAAADLPTRTRAIDGEHDGPGELRGSPALARVDRRCGGIEDDEANDSIVANQRNEQDRGRAESLPVGRNAWIVRHVDDQPWTPCREDVRDNARCLELNLRLEGLEGLPELGRGGATGELAHDRLQHIAPGDENRAALDFTRFGRCPREDAQDRGEPRRHFIAPRRLDVAQRNDAAVEEGAVGPGCLERAHRSAARDPACTIFTGAVERTFVAKDSPFVSAHFAIVCGLVLLRKLHFYPHMFQRSRCLA